MRGRPRKGYKWWRFVERHLPIIVIYLMVTTLIGFLIAPNVIVTVPTGHVGVLWKRFRGGTQLDPASAEGRRTARPAAVGQVVPVRPQAADHDRHLQCHFKGRREPGAQRSTSGFGSSTTPSRSSIRASDRITLRDLVRPEIGNRAREIIAEYTAEEVYSTKRQEIQKRIRTHTQSMLGQSMMQRTEEESEYGEHYRVSLDAMLNLYDTLVLGLELPQSVVAAINRKVEQYYLVQEYAFRVDRERKESERKRIEAEGISAFQQIVSQGISDSYVRWRGIEATLQLAQSPNSKIVIIGSGKDGLPVILGNVDTPVAPQGRAAASRSRQQRGRQGTADGRQSAAAGEAAGQQSADAVRAVAADRGAARPRRAAAACSRIAGGRRPPRGLWQAIRRTAGGTSVLVVHAVGYCRALVSRMIRSGDGRARATTPSGRECRTARRRLGLRQHGRRGPAPRPAPRRATCRHVPPEPHAASALTRLQIVDPDRGPARAQSDRTPKPAVD